MIPSLTYVPAPLYPLKDVGPWCSSGSHLLPNLPFHDDRTYAWSVEHLLKTGELRVLDWSVHYRFVQIIWESSFSFSALRSFTVVLAWLAGLALYGTLWEFGRTRSDFASFRISKHSKKRVCYTDHDPLRTTYLVGPRLTRIQVHELSRGPLFHG